MRRGCHRGFLTGFRFPISCHRHRPPDQASRRLQIDRPRHQCHRQGVLSGFGLDDMGPEGGQFSPGGAPHEPRQRVPTSEQTSTSSGSSPQPRVETGPAPGFRTDGRYSAGPRAGGHGRVGTGCEAVGRSPMHGDVLLEFRLCGLPVPTPSGISGNFHRDNTIAMLSPPVLLWINGGAVEILTTPWTSASFPPFGRKPKSAILRCILGLAMICYLVS